MAVASASLSHHKTDGTRAGTEVASSQEGCTQGRGAQGAAGDGEEFEQQEDLGVQQNWTEISALSHAGCVTWRELPNLSENLFSQVGPDSYDYHELNTLYQLKGTSDPPISEAPGSTWLSVA